MWIVSRAKCRPHSRRLDLEFLYLQDKRLSRAQSCIAFALRLLKLFGIDTFTRFINSLILRCLCAVDRMQVLPATLVKSYSADKDFLDSTRVNLAVRSSGHDLLSKTLRGRRGLQAFASPQSALNLKPCVIIYDGVCHLCNAGIAPFL